MSRLSPHDRAAQPPGYGPVSPVLTRRGTHVRVAPPRRDDLPSYEAAVASSAARLAAWNPVNPYDLRWHLDNQSDTHRTFLIWALDPRGSHGIVGKVNVTAVVRGRYSSAVMGYDAYDPYAGSGLFREGLRLVVDVALDRSGMDLHRVEASVQPGNTVSAGVLRSLGLRAEGASPSLLYLPDAEGLDAWRDHVTFAVRREEWPAPAYSPSDVPPVWVSVLGEPSQRVAFARRVARELGLPVLRGDLPVVAADLPSGAVWLGEGPRWGRGLVWPAPDQGGRATETSGDAEEQRQAVRAALAARAMAWG